jgi:flagellar assembly protein FliH
MASANAKFLFDEDFATGEKPTITTVEADRRRKDAEAVAFRNGFAAAQAEAVAEAEKRLAAAMTQIGDTLARLGRGLDGVEARLEVEAVQVALAVARKLAPALIAMQPFAEIEALAGECFRQLVAAPHVAIKVNDAMLAGAEQRLGELARTRGFEGRLMVSADPALAPGDCRVEWSDGGINRDRAATEDAIAEVVSRYIAARSADAN